MIYGEHVTNGLRYLILSEPFVGRGGHEYVWARTIYPDPTKPRYGTRFRLALEKVRILDPAEAPPGK